jgi:hypothetical protein
MRFGFQFRRISQFKNFYRWIIRDHAFMSSPDLPVSATYWTLLSPDDRSEYLRLRASFHHGQRISSKDRRVVTFRRELTLVMEFLERSPENTEVRCILAGVCFAGPVVCINTRQLKGFLKRCKSSINGSFQQLGYLALRTKAKAKACILSVLPSLQSDQNLLRQWTVRAISDDAEFCFVSSFCHAYLPEITAEDLLEERPPVVAKGFCATPQFAPPPLPSQFMRPPPSQASFKPKMLEFDLPSLPSDIEPDPDGNSVLPMATSWSMDFFRDFEANWLDLPKPPENEDEPLKRMHKSQSAGYGNGWDDPFDFF